MSELRFELKFACEASYLAQARSWLRLHPEGFREAYPPRWVHSLYLDTPNLNSFNANLEGVADREKLRLRWYGEGELESVATNPVLELKYKRNLLGGKKQQRLDCVLDWKRPYVDLLPQIKQQAATEWQQWLTAASQPVLLNRYRREYYVTVDGGIRATLDYAQSAYDQRLQLYPNLTRQLNLSDLIVIELKTASEHSHRLQWASGRFPIPRSRNSKYVNGVMAGLG